MQVPETDEKKIKNLINILKKKLRDDWIEQNPGADVKTCDNDERRTKFFTPVTDADAFLCNVVQQTVVCFALV